jgi:uncharacterized membrane protein
MGKKQNKENKKESKKSTGIILAIIAIIAITTIIVTSTSKNQETGNNYDGTITIPLSELSSTAQFFEEEIDGVKIKFFAIKDENGEVKTAFDACDVCFNSRKGYTQDGDYMVCNNCGNRYHVSGLGTENKFRGGCWPSYLPSEQKDDELIIKISDLAEGKYKFN